MFSKILIANRGEIACRVMRTARRLGARCVAVYSDADRDALHVALADEAYRLGPPPAAESYLKGDAIIEIARRAGAEAIHPGYGFLSENPGFVEAVEAAGLRFIGPSAKAIRAMGLKDAAKTLMEEAGVPVTPGWLGEDQDPKRLAAEAGKIGFPVLIKARAGGGGKGMRRVERAKDFAAALEACRREAEASFGDGACLLEKWISQPRHIEIQVFGDDHGNAVHLFERDCSLQRRHQKVIEEAPAPGMPAEMRAAMGEAAVKAAQAIGYSGAGTVEFIVDGSEGLRPDRFYFMEMNTRLQVEHPVTEAITGLDLVEWQLRVASGEPLPLRQDDFAIDGWAFEARIYAEDPARGFLPQIGRLTRLSLPEDRARIDSGVREGDVISSHYDPMIAKLIVHGPNRSAALAKLGAALDASRIAGVTANMDFLAALTRHEGFASGEVDTGLIDRDLGALVGERAAAPLAVGLAALGALGVAHPSRDPDPWAQLAGWRMWSDAKQYVALERDGAALEAVVTARGPHAYRIAGAGDPVEVRVLEAAGGRMRIESDGRVIAAECVVNGGGVTVFLDGRSIGFGLPDRLADEAAGEAGGDRVLAPMPGRVKLISAAQGATVSKGETLIVMEAMKMEHALAAPRDGVIAELRAAEGDQVEEGAVLLTLAPEEG